MKQGEFLNSQRNFGHFGDAIRLLFILATGESGTKYERCNALLAHQKLQFSISAPSSF